MGFLRSAAKAVLDAPGISPAVDAIDDPLTDAKGARAAVRDGKTFARSVVLGRTYYSLNPKRKGYAITFVGKSRSLGEPVTDCGTSASRIFKEFAPLTDRKPAGWKSIGQEHREAEYGIGGPNIEGSLHEFAEQPAKKRSKQRA